MKADAAMITFSVVLLNCLKQIKVHADAWGNAGRKR